MKTGVPTVFYDGSCGLCSSAIQGWQATLRRAGFSIAPLQGELAQQTLGLSDGEIPEEVKLLTHDGRVLGGVRALLHLARRIWWAWPIWAVSLVPGVRWVMGRIYRVIARRRHAISRVCRLDPNQHR